MSERKAGDLLTEGRDDYEGGDYEGGSDYATMFMRAMAVVVVIVILWFAYKYFIKTEDMCGIINEKHLANCLYYQQPYGKLSDKNSNSNSIMN